MNIFKEHYADYISKGYSVIPDKYGNKLPAIKSWSYYCFRPPTQEDLDQWSTIGDTNISVCMGRASNIVALDIDETRQDILDLVMPILPPSPVVKIGAKGETRFYRYMGEGSQTLVFNGQMVMEILSDNKKTTLPPSLHPSGVLYKWQGKGLLDVSVSSLPLLPPALFAHVESKLRLKFPDVQDHGGHKLESGRNNTLSSLCGTLIAEGTPIDEALKRLIEFDVANNKPPLFTDPEEQRHTESITNALKFYSNHLESINTRRYRDNKTYELPRLNIAPMGKERAMEQPKNPNKLELPLAQGVIRTIQQNILDNSWVKQPALAFSATLALMSTLVSRKLMFAGISPNLYILNVAPSGSGKDAPQQMVKKFLINIGAENLLGAGDYVSDASLMDSLGHSPVRLDIMDEAGGILRAITSGKSEYNGKMADILAELFTSSSSKFLGRATAEGIKGACFRPNVIILASTTPTGVTEGLTTKAIEKGLMGRFLIFKGDYNAPATRLRNMPELDEQTCNILRYWSAYKPKEDMLIGGLTQAVTYLKVTPQGEEALDDMFSYFDKMRLEEASTSPIIPIIARLYQQAIKITILHSVSRVGMGEPIIDVADIEFARLTVLYYLATIREVVGNYVFDTPRERAMARVMTIARDNGFISQREMSKLLRSHTRNEREQIMQDLLEGGDVIQDTTTGTTVYRIPERRTHEQ